MQFCVALLIMLSLSSGIALRRVGPRVRASAVCWATSQDRARSTNEVDMSPKVELGGDQVGADGIIMNQEDYLFGVEGERVTFREIGAHASLTSALEANGKATATIIQSKTFSAINSGRDVVIGAETGSGKTMAFMVPLLHQCLEAAAASSAAGEEREEDAKEEEEGEEEEQHEIEKDVSGNYPHTLVMVPNKELVQQVHSMTQELLIAMHQKDDAATASGESALVVDTCTSHMDGTRWRYRHGDAPDILICTPAIIAKFVRGPTLLDPDLFRHVKKVVFDEADMLLEGSYLGDVEKILEAFRLTRRESIRAGINGINDKTVQFILSAATLPTYGLKSLESYIQKKFPHAVRVSNDHLHKHHPQIRQCFVQAGGDGASDAQRVAAISEAITGGTNDSCGDNGVQGGSTMVFANTADSVQEVAAALRAANPALRIVEFHKYVHTQDKQANLAAFRAGEAEVLVCTDAAARGLDLPSVRHVVQAEFALNVVQYLHRIGRASRAGRAGKATSIVDNRSSDLVQSIRSGEEGDRSVAQSFSRKRGFRGKLKKEERREREERAV